MTMTPGPRGLKVVLGFAIPGGVVAAGGFFWVATIAAAHAHPFVDSPWDRVSTGPGLTAFVIGSVALLGALMWIRLHVHPFIGGRIIWTSVWIAWVAIALNCVGTTRTTANPFDGRGAFLQLLSFAVGFLAEIVLFVGVAFVILRLMDGAELNRTEKGAPGVRRPRIVVGVATAVAILGGLLTFVGYFAVAALEHEYMNNADVSHWNAASINPGAAAFVIGSVALLGALLTIRLRARPRPSASFIWASSWLFWAAIALNCLGLALSTDPSSAISSQVILLSIVIGVAAAVVLLFGIVVYVRRLSNRRQLVSAAVPASSKARAKRDPGRSSFPVG
jgi:hypothetical protein